MSPPEVNVGGQVTETNQGGGRPTREMTTQGGAVMAYDQGTRSWGRNLPLPSFSQEDFRGFFRQMRRRVAVESMTDSEAYDLCLYAIGSEAKSEWLATRVEEVLPKTEEGVPSLKDIEDCITECLEPQHVKTFILRDLDRLQLRQSQDPREYVNEVYEKVQRAVPEGKADTWKIMAINYAVKGTPASWQVRLHEANCQTLDSLVRKMTTMRLSENFRPVEARVMKVNRTEMRCFHCGEPGHFVSRCPKKQDVRAQGRKCYGCGKEGHLKANCPVWTKKKGPSQGKSTSCKRIGTNEVKMDVKLEGKQIEAVVDTGTRYNLISARMADEVNLKKVKMEEPSLTTADGTKLETRGCVWGDMSAGEGPAHATQFVVVEDLVDELIIGLETLKDLKASIQCDEMLVTVKRVPEDIRDEYPNLFARDSEDIGQVKGYKYKIQTSGPPVVCKPYKVPIHYQEEVERQLTEMEARGMICKSTSEYSSPVVVVRKAGGNELRICCDYSKLNKQVTREAYPVPALGDVLMKLRSGRIFTHLDVKSAYHNIPLDPETKHKTAFAVGGRLWEWNVLPFGLCTSGQVFQRVLDEILEGLDYVTAYADDISIYTKEDDEDLHMRQVNEVLRRLEGAGMKLRPDKCVFAQRTIECLGHRVSHDAVSALESKTEDIRSWPEPETVQELRQFLGLCGFYRMFVPRYSEISAPLTDLLRKDTRFKWEKEQRMAFRKLKEELVSPRTLAEADPKQPFVLTCDASEIGCGAVLENGGRPVAFASKRWNPSEAKKSTTERELNGMIFGIKKFAYFLKGATFKVVTDHQPLAYIREKRNAEEHLKEKMLRLGDYDFEIEYRPGKEIPHADALSRKPVRRIEVAEADLAEAIEDDETLKAVRDGLMLGGTWDSDTPEKRFYETQKANLTVEDGIIWRGSQEEKQIVLPVRFRRTVLNLAHDHPSAGHMGVRRTLARITCRYYWYNVKKDVREWIQNCLHCARNKIHRAKHQEGMGTVGIIGKPGAQWGADILGPLPKTSRGKRYVLVVTDLFTKWVELFALKDVTADTVARKLAKVFRRFPNSQEVLTDQGKNFECELVRSLCKLLQIKKLKTTPYHPPGNGQTERFNATLCDILRSNDSETSWDEMLPWAASAFNTSVHASTGYTPHELVYGDTPRGVIAHEVVGPDGVKMTTYAAHDRDLRKKIARKTQEALESIKDGVRSRVKPPSGEGFAEGSKVMLKDQRRKGKLTPLWKGPFEVVAVARPDYVICQGGKKYRIHGVHLKAWKGDQEGTEAEEDEVEEAEEPDIDVDEDELEMGGGESDAAEADSPSEAGLNFSRSGRANQPQDDEEDEEDVFSFLPAATSSGRNVNRNPRYM